MLVSNKLPTDILGHGIGNPSIFKVKDACIIKLRSPWSESTSLHFPFLFLRSPTSMFWIRLACLRRSPSRRRDEDKITVRAQILYQEWSRAPCDQPKCFERCLVCGGWGSVRSSVGWERPVRIISFAHYTPQSSKKGCFCTYPLPPPPESLKRSFSFLCPLTTHPDELDLPRAWECFYSFMCRRENYGKHQRRGRSSMCDGPADNT